MSRELGFDTDYFQVHIHPVRISQESMAIMQAGWHAAGIQIQHGALCFAALGTGSFLGD